MHAIRRAHSTGTELPRATTPLRTPRSCTKDGRMPRLLEESRILDSFLKMNPLTLILRRPCVCEMKYDKMGDNPKGDCLLCMVQFKIQLRIKQ